MPIDAYASAPWYVDHMAPVWRALGPEAGRFHVRTSRTLAAATAAGLERVTSDPPAGSAPLFTVAIGDHFHARRLGRRRLALGQHGAGQSYGGAGGPAAANSSYPGGDGQDDVGLFLVPNDQAARRTLATYPRARVAVVGCPKLDDQPGLRSDAPPGVVAVSVHWAARLAPEAGSAWPAFRRAILETGRRFRAIGHAHPRERNVGPFYRAAGIEVVDSFREVLERASVFVCDNSSALFEFAATGRPVVLLNAPSYRRTVDHGLRFEPRPGCPLQRGWHFCGASHVGSQVDTSVQLMPAIERALELRPADVAAREAALELVYQPRHGSAALAARALLEWAGEARVEAA
jgi:hypothetical protein